MSLNVFIHHNSLPPLPFPWQTECSLLSSLLHLLFDYSSHTQATAALRLEQFVPVKRKEKGTALGPELGVNTTA